MLFELKTGMGKCGFFNPPCFSYLRRSWGITDSSKPHALHICNSHGNLPFRKKITARDADYRAPGGKWIFIELIAAGSVIADPLSYYL
jgi:hypothetical protein